MAVTAGQAQPADALSQLRAFAADIKVSHSIFAMPWALLSAVMAYETVIHRSDTNRAAALFGRLGLIVVCMIFARTVAMAANRLLDARLDAMNPRTARRAIPAGRSTTSFATASLAACALGFIGTTSLFGIFYANWTPLFCSVPVLLFISAYPMLKRFTGLCHYYLGVCLALAPVCAWVAVTGRFDLSPFLMAAAVLCWTAGFDIIYACQDYQSDLQNGLFSVPAKIGISGALWVARLTHLACIAMLAALGLLTPVFGVLYGVAVVVASVLLAVEHSLVKPNDLSKVNLAFFTLNGAISLVIGALGIADIYL